MSDEDPEGSWSDFFEGNIPVPPHSSRSFKDDDVETTNFCLTLDTFEYQVESQDALKFQHRITFFDSTNQCFFGGTWIGPILSSKVKSPGNVYVDLNEVCYFHTINDSSTIAVVEVSQARGNHWETLGWGWIRIFSNIDLLADTDEISRTQERRLEFYHGSSMALHYIPEPIADYLKISSIDGCSLSFTLKTHEALANVKHFVPENVIVSGDDIIPGVHETTDENDGYIDILKSPQPIKPWPCILKKLSIKLLPSLETFEEKLCDLLNYDRLVKDQVVPDGAAVQISERKLKVGVHNGWRFVRTPHVMYLDKRYAPSTPTKNKKTGSNRSLNKSFNAGKEVIGLLLRNQLELDEMVFHPLFAIIFQIDYVVNIPCAQAELNESKRNRTKLSSSFSSHPMARKCTVSLRSVNWIPFENGNMGNTKISLNLNGGLAINPFETMLLTELSAVNTELSDESLGQITFDFSQPKLRQSASMGSLSSYGAESLKARNPVYATTPVQAQQSDELFYTGSPDQTDFNPMSLKPPLPVTPSKSPSRLSHAAKEETQYMQEVSMVHQPYPYVIATPNIEMHRPVTMNRTALSQLHSIGYPKINDSNGNPPFTVDPQEKTSYDVSREMKDHLHASEINIQFLAVSCCNHRTVFFTFQFYRFPQTTTERMFLKDFNAIEQDRRNIPCVLQRSSKDGTQSEKSPPGLLVKYTVDPSYMQAGEKTSFINYLNQQKLHIDMWDGDSLLLIGSTSVQLRHLLRQNHPAVQVSQEVDVTFRDHVENLITNDTLGPQPSDIRISLKAKLYLKMANVGYLPDGNIDKMKSSTPSVPNQSLAEVTSVMQPLKTSAKLMSDCDTELATALLSRNGFTGKTNKMKKEEVDKKRNRKIERMAAVRQLSDGTDVPSAYILKKEENLQRTRDLRTIQLYRERVKGNVISSRLEENITSNHLLYCSLGKVSFFEFPLKNPYSIDQVVFISWEDKELAVVTNTQEWRYLKATINSSSVIEEQMFSTTDGGAKLFLKASELVYVPFKFQSFTSENVTPPMGPSHPSQSTVSEQILQTFGKDTTFSSKDIKIRFAGNENKSIAILQLQIELHPHSIDQTYRFFQAEQTFLKNVIRMPPLHTLPAYSLLKNQQMQPKIKVFCSDESSLCVINQIDPGDPLDVHLKVPCGLSPSVKRFYVVIFLDEFCSNPCQIWQVFVHSLQRIDITATEGQTSRLSVLLKGSQTSRMVKCFSSHPDELTVSPKDSFMIASGGVQEIALSVQPIAEGRRMMYVNVVDLEFFQLVKSWLIMVTCNSPHLSKVFEIKLKVGGGPDSNKKITFTNPYPIKKSFYFKTNRDDLLRFKEDGVMIDGGKSYIIGFTFIPQMSVGTATILVFINDREGKNEETFKIACNYVL